MKIGALASLLAAAVMAASPTLASAQDIDQFKPNGPWALDYGEDYCRLARTFTNGRNELSVAFDRIQPAPFMRMVVAGDTIRPFRRATTIGWRFLPSDAQRDSAYTKGQSREGLPFINLGQVAFAQFAPPPPGTAPTPPEPITQAKEREQAKGITGFVLQSGLPRSIEVETESLEAPVQALQACADDLAKGWGLDPEKLKTQSVPAMPEGGGAGWLPAGTIAFTDFVKFIDGSNQVRLMVDAAGKTTSCHIHWPVLSNSTNEKICSTLMANAKFTPARDAQGQPMASYYMTMPTFLLPPFGS